MTKIMYNSKTMVNNTSASIQNCNSNLKKAIEVSSSLVIPSDYVDIEYLKNLPNLIEANSKSLTNFSDWINNNDYEYSKIIKKLESDINDIDNVVIKKRIGYISSK